MLVGLLVTVSVSVRNSMSSAKLTKFTTETIIAFLSLRFTWVLIKVSCQKSTTTSTSTINSYLVEVVKAIEMPDLPPPPPFQLRLIISSRFIGHCKEFLRLTFGASALLCNTLNVSFRNSLINLVDKTKLSFYSTPSMQHPSFFRNLPPLFRLVIACFNFELLLSPYTGKPVRLLFTILLIVCCDYVPFGITKLDGKTF